MLTLPQHIELRNALHQTIYSDKMRVGYMVELLNGLDLFNITFDDINKTISLKVKKTNIKKIYGSSYQHDARFYISIIDTIFKQMIHNYRCDIYNYLRGNKTYEGFNFELPLENFVYINSICTVNVLLDNMVIIKL